MSLSPGSKVHFVVSCVAVLRCLPFLFSRSKTKAKFVVAGEVLGVGHASQRDGQLGKMKQDDGEARVSELFAGTVRFER